MKQAISDYISELLFSHDCVIIPGFGGFVANTKSAKLNSNTNKITPPSKKILFNKKLVSNDGLLISYVAEQEAISNEKAKRNVEKFVKETITQLDDSKILRLDNIGLFTISKENNLLFIQDNSINYNLSVFGMENIYNKPIIRKLESKKELKTTIKRINNYKTNPKYIIKVAAILLPLILLSYLGISYEEKINSIYINMADLTPKVKYTTDNDNSEDVFFLPEEKKPVLNTDIKKEKNYISAIDNKTKTYYLIAGSFIEKKNATNLYKKLIIENYSSEILSSKKFLRVSYNSFANKDEAMLALKELKQVNKDAWLLTQ